LKGDRKGAYSRRINQQHSFVYEVLHNTENLTDAKETLINCLCGRIAKLFAPRGARNLDIFLYMPRFLRSVRLALHPAQTIYQRFHIWRAV
jgi:hypothetical protein